MNRVAQISGHYKQEAVSRFIDKWIDVRIRALAHNLSVGDLGPIPPNVTNMRNELNRKNGGCTFYRPQSLMDPVYYDNI